MTDLGAGIVFIDPEDKVLLLSRSMLSSVNPGMLDFPGGSVDGDEGVIQTAFREAYEETGWSEFELHAVGKIIVSEPELYEFVALVYRIPEIFEPILSDEHCGYLWEDYWTILFNRDLELTECARSVIVELNSMLFHDGYGHEEENQGETT